MLTQTDPPVSFPMVTLYTQFLSMYRHFCFHPPFSSYLFHEDHSLCLCLCPRRYLACHATLSSRQKEGGGEREPPTRSGRLCAALYCMSLPPLVSNARQRLKGIPRLEKVCVEVVVKYTGMSFLSFMLHSCGYCCCQVLNHVQGSTGSLANKTLFGGGMG